MPDGSFNLKGNVTRAEATAMLHRYMNMKREADDMAGGYTVNRHANDEDLAVFKEAFQNEPVDVNYEPTLVQTAVIAETKYRFKCTYKLYPILSLLK